jgi:PTS system nitrogen regulatory IIA component
LSLTSIFVHCFAFYNLVSANQVSVYNARRLDISGLERVSPDSFPGFSYTSAWCIMTRMSTQDVARRLGVPATTIERWIRQGRIPAYQDGRDCVFDQKELEYWARAHNITYETSPRQSTSLDEAEATDLVATMQRGGVFYETTGRDVSSVLAAAAHQVPVAAEVRNLLLQRLLEREEMASTGIGNGVAIPHPRSPLTGIISEPMISTFFLAQPIDFGAVDGKLVSTLFILLSPAVKIHLQLLSQLAFRLRDDAFVALLETVPEPDQLWSRLADEG